MKDSILIRMTEIKARKEFDEVWDIAKPTFQPTLIPFSLCHSTVSLYRFFFIITKS